MTIEYTSKENVYSKHSVNYFQSWHMGTTDKLLQTAVQKHNTINEIVFCLTSYTCYIYPTTMSGNLKWKKCAYGREFKLKVEQYANNWQTAFGVQCFGEASVQLAKILA